MKDEMTVALAEGSIPAAEFLARLARVAKQLREGLRELGVDQKVTEVAQAIPDARDRLSYIATATERAATNALNAIDVAKPLCARLREGASDLDARWAAAGNAPSAELVAATRGYLAGAPQRVADVEAQLMNIMMAQDFQDLTGQMIKKLMAMINEADSGLIQLLRDFAPASLPPSAEDAAARLQNGPALGGDAVVSQQDADDLLASLGL